MFKTACFSSSLIWIYPNKSQFYYKILSPALQAAVQRSSGVGGAAGAAVPRCLKQDGSWRQGDDPRSTDSSGKGILSSWVCRGNWADWDLDLKWFNPCNLTYKLPGTAGQEDLRHFSRDATFLGREGHVPAPYNVTQSWAGLGSCARGY